MEFYAGQPFTNDVLESITLYGRTFDVVNDAVTIPTTKGEVVVTLDTTGKRKDWFYQVCRGIDRFILVDFKHLVEALHRIIREEELLDAKG